MVKDAHPAFVPFCRYILGGISTIIASSVVFCGVVRIDNSGKDLLFSGPQNALTVVGTMAIGFLGVMAGTLFAPADSRRISTWAYAMVGAFFYIWVWSDFIYPLFPRMKFHGPPLPLLPWALLGGLACCLIFSLWRIRQTSQLP